MAEEGVKLFVGQVPKHMTEEQVLAMLKEFALVEEVNIIRDRATRASRGCCFVICPSREEADKAVNACHNKKTLPGASSPLQVKYADGELERLEHKLFIGMLPKNISEVEISDLFSKYGTIKDLQILRGSQQTSKGCAFLKYENKEQAVAALEAINGKHKMESPGPGHCNPLCEEAPLLPKLRSYFAEFLKASCLTPLGILYLLSCVSFGYRYPFVKGHSSFSWECGMDYFSTVEPGTPTLARGVFSTPYYPEKVGAPLIRGP
ncbi:hypothetical protein RJT34_22720 [Clitoria ternatea]|uniref:RRM domain-containing protein n=1 Tax=Clitoria ternatea TaxID=43366 RepID=A0AAN9IHR3_CLITE